MKKLILDYSKWRCGGYDYVNKLGGGYTKLLNEEGFQCCLGQFALQLDCSVDEISWKYTPDQIKKPIELLNFITNDELIPFGISYFSSKAIGINDSPHTTPLQKIALLTELCNEHNIELEVINQPENIPA